VTPDAALQYLKPGKAAFDAGLLKAVDEHVLVDSVIWDIGACVGVFAFGAASIARQGKTLAIEADIRLAHLMKKSISLNTNRGLNINVLPCAVSDRNGVASFLIANRGRQSNSLQISGGRSQMGGVREKVYVPTITLDTLLDFFDPPNLVKIDVEGAENLVLRGASRLLADIRPIIYVEVDGDSSTEVAGIFRMNRYELFDGAKPIKEQEPADYCSYNTLAIPQERITYNKARQGNTLTQPFLAHTK
jgi:FkbM family methyltransferase